MRRKSKKLELLVWRFRRLILIFSFFLSVYQFCPRQYLSRCLFVPMGLPKFGLRKLPKGQFMFYCLMVLCIFVGWDNVVGIATRYGLESRVSNPSGGQNWPHPSWPALAHTQPAVQWIPGLFSGGKAAGSWWWPLIPSRAEVKERVELYLCSPSGPAWPVLGRIYNFRVRKCIIWVIFSFLVFITLHVPCYFCVSDFLLHVTVGVCGIV